ncbi:Cell wall-associated hydrolase [Methylacidimicrobium sp. AP8]|uniref:C40 family peptidase n=1 Tax=Methylacidimicrobium sp. AP8 TaxID=2730359 RepID=UPI0018C19131|nr:NlpC/P60 family protein [Methylacidimicrobium sp. AP8]CAB4243956.1 Cell wall-associated hydrolase [Methylacidimicrobium sp. AP8]
MNPKPQPQPPRLPRPGPRTGAGPLLLALLLSVAPAGAQEREPAAGEEKRPAGMAPDASLRPEDLADFDRQPAPVRELIRQALLLTGMDLTYRYGSADPATGGIDCSGFVYFVLRRCGIRDVPRTASGQYAWVRKAGNFRAVLSPNPDSFEMDELRPGDLLFWEGTYATKNDPPVSHSMIYLGREKATGERVMAGASDGRTYHGKPRWGASVFDFRPKFPGPEEAPGGSRFVGYGKIPGLESGNGLRGPEEREE